MDATKQRMGREEALQLLDGVKTLIAARGQKVVTHDLVKQRPPDDELLALMMGPTGNLRAPTVRVGSTLMIGFNEAAYRKLLGIKEV